MRFGLKSNKNESNMSTNSLAQHRIEAQVEAWPLKINIFIFILHQLTGDEIWSNRFAPFCYALSGATLLFVLRVEHVNLILTSARRLQCLNTPTAALTRGALSLTALFRHSPKQKFLIHGFWKVYRLVCFDATYSQQLALIDRDFQSRYYLAILWLISQVS